MPVEIWSQIASHLSSRDDTNSLIQLCLTCRLFRGVFTPFVYRRMRLRIDERLILPNDLSVLNLLDDDRFAQNIRSLTLDKFSPHCLGVFTKAIALEALRVGRFDFKSISQQRAFVASANNRKVPLSNLTVVHSGSCFCGSHFGIGRLRYLWLPSDSAIGKK